MKIRNTLSAFVGSIITSILGETNMRSFVLACIQEDLKSRNDHFVQMITEAIDQEEVTHQAAKNLADHLDASDIAEEVRDAIKGDLDVDSISDDIKQEIKDNIDEDDIRNDLVEALKDDINTSDIADSVKQEIIDGMDDDFSQLVVEEISGKICPDNVSEEIVQTLCDRGDFSECVKREVIQLLAKQFAEQHTEDFKASVRSLAQGAKAVLTAAQEVLGEAASRAADASIAVGEALESGVIEDVIVAQSASMVAEYEQALALVEVASENYTKQIKSIESLQLIARQAEDEMSNASHRLRTAELVLRSARIDIRQACKNTL